MNESTAITYVLQVWFIENLTSTPGRWIDLETTKTARQAFAIFNAIELPGLYQVIMRTITETVLS